MLIREVDVGTGAGAHAKFVGTNQAAGLSHRVVAGDGFHGAVKIVLDCFGDEFLRIAVNRTGIHAGFGFAGKAASEVRQSAADGSDIDFVSHFNLSEINRCL